MKNCGFVFWQCGLLFFSLFVFNTANAQGVWTWMHGDSIGSAFPAGAVRTAEVYGAFGAFDVSYTPGSRYRGSSCVDKDGMFWLYSGQRPKKNSGPGVIQVTNDLWKYDPTINQWALIKGNLAPNQSKVVWGIKGVESTSTMPPENLIDGAMLVDTNNNIWMVNGACNILWRYNISTNSWTWMTGDTTGVTTGTLATYGTKGIGAPGNSPPKMKENLSFWLHKKTNTIWLLDNSGDLWKYNIADNEWAWMQGNHAAYGNFGTMGVESANNYIAQGHWHDYHTTWMADEDDFIYVFDQYSTAMFRYNMKTNLWMWIAGADTSRLGNTVTAKFNSSKCTFEAVAKPRKNTEGRAFDNTFRKDFLWSYGSYGGHDTTQTGLWVFDPDVRQWSWADVGYMSTRPVRHGTKGVADTRNKPVLMGGFSHWVDLDGNFWTYSGLQNGGVNGHATMWKYEPDPCCYKRPISFPTLNYPDTIICKNEEYTFDLPVTKHKLSLDPLGIIMDNGDGTATVSKTATNELINITLTARAGTSCEVDSVYSFRLDKKDCTPIPPPVPMDTMFIKVPSAFTPNGDGLNDVLNIIYRNVTIKDFQIYNRWGQRVFRTNNINQGWDGTFNGEEVGIGTYFYFVRYNELVNDRKQLVIKGDVNVIR